MECNNKWSKICVIEVPEGKEREQGKSNREDIVTEFSKTNKSINLRFTEFYESYMQ